MTHKASADFFRQKREWSKRKDLILGYYLTPYLPKIATQRKPICIVDAFAGPGQFDDGELGSPLIICNALQNAVASGIQVPVKSLLIEADASLCSRLRTRVAEFSFASVRHGSFLEHLPEIVSIATTHNVFLYLDPYTVEGLDWKSMDQIFARVNGGVSIEILLNFNAFSFVRRGLAALKLNAPPAGTEFEDIDEPGSSVATSMVDDLDAVVGGNWWQAILRSSLTCPEQVDAVTTGYCDRLRSRFQEVCAYPVKENSRHRIPKYLLIFASRHPDALELMNDATCRARDSQAESEAPTDLTLFEMRPESLVPDLQHLPELLRRSSTKPMRRGDLVQTVIRSAFCRYSSWQIRRTISQLIKEEKIASETGRARINDDVLVWWIGS